MAKISDQEVDFEASFQKLEETVQRLEQGGLTLSQATGLYEEGMRLAHLCGQRLDQAELKVRELQSAYQQSGDGTETPDA